ncbi:hypothetical protein G6F57_021685 [Rhizopus arrhizus]|nr:hypothetical protein G6F57_021685 [Rhizopus arrhizus]
MEHAPVMAEAFNAAGAAVATLEYTLVPEATLGEVVREFGGRASGRHAGRARLARPVWRAGRRDQGDAGAKRPVRPAAAVRHPAEYLAAADARASGAPEPDLPPAGARRSDAAGRGRPGDAGLQEPDRGL